MNGDPIFTVDLRLTSVQAEMLMQLVHHGLSGKLNMGWRKPEEWIELTNRVTAALSFARDNPHSRT